MRYALLVGIEENEELSEQDAARQYAEFMAFQDEMEARGVLISGERLRPTSLATTVRVRDEGLVVADGPFAETLGADRRLLHHRVRGSRRGDRDCLEKPWRPPRHDRGQAGVGDIADAHAAVAEAFRSDWGRVVGYLIRVTGNWDLAEECAQDAFTKATPEIARAFLVAQETMAKRLTRARNNIVDARIPYRVP